MVFWYDIIWVLIFLFLLFRLKRLFWYLDKLVCVKYKYKCLVVLLGFERYDIINLSLLSLMFVFLNVFCLVIFL